MAHELSIREDGVVEAAFMEVPWHRLGTLVPAGMTPTQALEAAHLNWQVDQVALYTKDVQGEYVVVNDKKAVVRMDTQAYLGVVGNRYQAIQNAEQSSFIEALVGEGAMVEAVGALYGGRKTFWTVKAPETLLVAGGDKISEYLILTNTHDGSRAFTAFWSPVRVVCNNTLNAALRHMDQCVTIRHTGEVMSKVNEARSVLGIMHNYYQELGDVFNRFKDTPIEAPRFTGLVEALVPELENGKLPPKRLEARTKITENYREDLGQAGETVWGFYNAVTQFTSHQRGRQAASPDSRFESIMYGTSRGMQQEAFELAAEVAGVLN